MEVDSREIVEGIVATVRPGLEETAANWARTVAAQELNTYVPSLVRDLVYATTRPRHVWRVGRWQLEWTLRGDR